MIVFVEGVDGSGKTTLIGNLFAELARRGRPAVVAPPLWTFLEPIADPADFAPWVRATPGIDVGHQLLLAMSRRLNKLRTDIHLGILNSEAVVFVDRGPKTVRCSALAHASPGRPYGELTADSTPDLLTYDRMVGRELDRLTEAIAVGAVELRVEQTDNVTFDRLAKQEHLSTGYLAYLAAFARHMARGRHESVPYVVLDARCRLATNTSEALAWLERWVPGSSPSGARIPNARRETALPAAPLDSNQDHKDPVGKRGGGCGCLRSPPRRREHRPGVSRGSATNMSGDGGGGHVDRCAGSEAEGPEPGGAE